MSIHRPAYRRNANLPVSARQATTGPASNTQTSFPVPTGRIDLSTVFEGPSTCSQNLLTMLPPPSYEIWANEPVPKANLTVAACQPSEFLQSYTAVMVGTKPSSIVPAMTNFACPKNYCTAMAAAKNYIVCCPTSYQFHPPDTVVDPFRSFYGGRCYSDMTSGSSYPVLQYNTDGDTASILFPVTATTVQAFAHPIDGFAATSPTALGCSVSSGLRVDTSKSPESSSSNQASPSVTPGPAPATGVSGGAIAGAVVGAIVGLAAIVGLIFFLLARRRKQDGAPAPPPKGGEGDYPHGIPMEVQSPTASEVDGNSRFAEMGAAIVGAELYDEKKGAWAQHARANDGYGAFEMPADHAAEMDAGAPPKDPTKQGFI